MSNKPNLTFESNPMSIIKKLGFRATTTVEFNGTVRRVPSKNGAESTYMIFERITLEEGIYCRVYMNRQFSNDVLITRIIDYSICNPLAYRNTYFNILAMPMIDKLQQLTEQVVFRGELGTLNDLRRVLNQAKFKFNQNLLNSIKDE